MKTTGQGCDLCGLPLPAKDYSVKTPDRPMRFCCEGCKGIWLMLHPEAEKGEGHDPSDDGNL